MSALLPDISLPYRQIGSVLRVTGRMSLPVRPPAKEEQDLVETLPTTGYSEDDATALTGLKTVGIERQGEVARPPPGRCAMRRLVTDDGRRAICASDWPCGPPLLVFHHPLSKRRYPLGRSSPPLFRLPPDATLELPVTSNTWALKRRLRILPARANDANLAVLGPKTPISPSDRP